MTVLRKLPPCLIAWALSAACTPRGEAARSGQADSSRAATGDVRVERVLARGQDQIYGVRGPAALGHLVFLHGMCAEPEAYVEQFKHVVAKRGVLVSPRGDAPCPDGRGSTYSTDLEALDQRILQGFIALEANAPQNVLIIGYSLGAVRAQEMARKFPNRYTRLVLIGAPETPEPYGLTHLQSAVMVVGERERQDLMRRGAVKLRSAKIPTTFMLLPEAKHGELGPDAERVLASAIDWQADVRPETL